MPPTASSRSSRNPARDSLRAYDVCLLDEYSFADWSIYDDKLNRAAKQVLEASSLGTTSNPAEHRGDRRAVPILHGGARANASVGFLSSRNDNAMMKGNFTYTITPEHRLKVQGSYTRDVNGAARSGQLVLVPWFQTVFKHDSIDAESEWRNPYDGRTYVSIDEFDKFRITYRNHRTAAGSSTRRSFRWISISSRASATRIST